MGTELFQPEFSLGTQTVYAAILITKGMTYSQEIFQTRYADL